MPWACCWNNCVTLLILSLSSMAQAHSNLHAMNCTFTNNDALRDGGAIYMLVRRVSQSNAIETLFCNHFLKHLCACTRVQWGMMQNNTFLLWDQTSSLFQYLVWNRVNFYIIGFKWPASMICWCDCSTSLGVRLLCNADILPSHGCIHKSAILCTQKRAMVHLTK